MRITNEKKLNKYLPVVIGKDLAQARFSMTLWERRLMYVCMSKLKSEDIDFPIVSFTIPEIAELIDDKSLSKHDRDAIILSAKKLIKREVDVKENGKRRIYNWVSYFEFDEKRNEITMQFNEHMKPHLLYMLESKGYTKFLLKYGMKLSGEYAQRIYEMFRGMVSELKTSAVQQIELLELRERLEMPPEKLKTFGHFKSRVLDIAQNDINQKSDIFISFKDIRARTKGRPVIALYVSVILKAHMVHEWDSFMLWQKDDLLEKLYYLVEKSKGQKLQLSKLEKYSHESIARLTYEINEGVIDLLKINNHQGFIEWQLENWKTEIGMNQISIDEQEGGE